jgi:signal transduction histidine kinase
VPSRLPDIIGRTIEEVWPEHSSLTAACRYVLTSGKLLRLVDKWFTAGQSPNDTPGRRYWTWSLSRVKLPASDGWGLMSVFIETTERKRAEEALRESEAKLLRLAGGLMEAQESERRKLARELHEDISQRLAAWSLTATALATRDTPRIGELAQQASELCSDIGRIARRLDSSIVETLGLAPALESLCIEFSRIGFLPIDFQKAHSCALEAQTALNLYRIAEEALWNVIQHSDAERASVRLIGGRRAVILTIRDSGRGFDTAQQMGLGLLSIQERVRRLRGTFHLKSQPQHGTELRITIPTQDFQTV